MCDLILPKSLRRRLAPAALAVVALLPPPAEAGAAGAAPAPEDHSAPCDTSAISGALRQGLFTHEVYDLVDEPPEILSEVPRLAGPARTSGTPDTVWVRVLIACDGSAIFALGHPMYVHGRLQSAPGMDGVISRLRFKPAVLNARPVSVWGWLPIEVGAPQTRASSSARGVLFSPVPYGLLSEPDSLLKAYFHPTPSDTTWKRLQAGHVYSFLAPPGLHSIPVMGIDSFVSNYYSASMRMSSNYGMYTGQPDEGTPETIEVSGLPGTLRISRSREPGPSPYFSAYLYVRVLEPLAGELTVSSAETQSLGIFIECLTERDLSDAVRLLRSVAVLVEPLVARASISDTLRVIPEEQPPGAPKVSTRYHLDRIPEFVTKVMPQYPAAARAASLGGTVVVRARVGADGRAHDIRVTKSVEGLDESAIEAVQASVFNPGLLERRPVDVQVDLEIRFIPR
jgi:TonB family protein